VELFQQGREEQCPFLGTVQGNRLRRKDCWDKGLDGHESIDMQLSWEGDSQWNIRIQNASSPNRLFTLWIHLQHQWVKQNMTSFSSRIFCFWRCKPSVPQHWVSSRKWSRWSNAPSRFQIGKRFPKNSRLQKWLSVYWKDCSNESSFW